MDQDLIASESLSVLIADDIESSRSALSSLVKSLGHKPIEAHSGLDALQLIELLNPDVALLDLLMPAMDGFQVALEIRKRVTGRWLPVIILSSLTGDDFIDQALSTGAADYLIKPVMPGILRAKLNQYQRVLSMQRRLATLAQRHHAIHDHISDAIVTTDDTGRIQEINRAGRVAFSLEDLSLQRGVYLQDITGHALQPLMEMSTIEIPQANATSLLFGVSYKGWEQAGQEFFTFALHDLSESRRVERMKDEFLATVSHELRTPLASILGALGLMAAGAAGKLPDAAQELTLVAKRNGDRLGNLIDDMLDLTKLEGNRMTMNTRPIELMGLLQEAIEANLSYARRLEVQLQLEAPDTDCRVQIDPDRFLQIMANLLSNAIKHSPKGAVVLVRMKRMAHQAQIDVIDQGPGIDPAFKSKLFEKFSQADGSDRRAIGGTGLGLYISRMLIEKMGGTISTDSGPAVGSTFRLTLPRILKVAERPWLLCLAKDPDLKERLSDWLSELGTVETVDSVAAARESIARLGVPAVLMASPQAQGPSNIFCDQLMALVNTQHIALIGDSFCSGLASRYGMTWLEQSAPRHVLLERVRTLVSDGNER